MENLCILKMVFTSVYKGGNMLPKGQNSRSQKCWNI